MRVTVVVGFALLALAAAPAARADVTIGSTFGMDPLSPLPMAPEGGLTAATSGATVPAAGVITRWRVRVGADSTPVRLRVLRPGTPGLEVGRSDPKPAPPANSTTVYETRIPVAQGDRIALECCVAAQGGFFAEGVGQSTDLWSPPIGDGAQFGDPTGTPVGTALDADVEPDRDGDGDGDDTQDDDDDADGVSDTADACPTVAGTGADGCPPSSPPQAAPRVNSPPTVRFRTPMAGTAIGPSQTIELEVSDDAGSPTVTVFDDDGTICTVSAAPYSCTWNPTGADVGRATLLASAVDSDGRSTLGIVRVRVSRFEADLTARRRGRRVSGRLVLPAAVERSLGCAGDVTVRRGKLRRTVALKRNCTYSVRLPRGRGTPRARFAGNPVVEPAT